MFVEEKYLIGYQYVGADLKIMNSAILRLLEDMAGLHGILAGESIKTAPTTWLLTAYKVIVKKRPEYGERVTVRTWSREAKNYFACREFEMLNENGDVAVLATSEWAHINRLEGKLEKCTPELAAAYEPEPDYTNFGAVRIKRVHEPQEFSYERQYTIERNWIDANHHMNNVYYLDLAEMSLPEETVDSFCSDSFEIFYRKEIKCGDNIRCRVADTDEGIFISVVESEGETVHAQILLHR